MQKKAVVLSLFALLSIVTVAKESIGDVNGDGKVNLTDITSVVSYILGNDTSELNINLADVNKDGKINISDVTCLVNNVLYGKDGLGADASFDKDTLFILYTNNDVEISNPDQCSYIVESKKTDIEVFIKGKNPFHTISISGDCKDGRLRVVSDTIYNLRLNGINLKSSHAPAINSSSKQKMTVELVKGTQNFLKDAKKYSFDDAEETANACLCSQGNITFTGKGVLSVDANMKHGICSGKGMKLNQGKICVTSAPSDAIHSGKYIYLDGTELILDGQKQDGMDADEEIKITKGSAKITIVGEDAKAFKCEDFIMKDGSVEMTLNADMSKGIKAKGDIKISGGTINAIATGNVVIDKGSPTYCTIIKGDSNALITGGVFNFISNGEGGKGISIDKNLRIVDGKFHLECNGGGAEYINANNETDYYTPKCLAADDTLFIERGEITCISTGLGGKGIVADEFMVIGLPTDTIYSQGPTIDVVTKGTCIIDNVDEDLRFGCPKGIKVNDFLHIYSGNICVKTEGMGGEGVECNNEFYFHNGMLECNCYDDGINVGNKLEILGGYVYCYSQDNDGIDSNGSIYLNGGLVTSVNAKKPNESLDSESHQLYLNGATVFAIGSSSVKIGSSLYPYYNTTRNNNPEIGLIDNGICLTKGKYLYLIKDNNVIMALQNENEEPRSYVTYTSKDFSDNNEYYLYEGDIPLEPQNSLFGGKLILGGNESNTEFLRQLYIINP